MSDLFWAIVFLLWIVGISILIGIGVILLVQIVYGDDSEDPAGYCYQHRHPYIQYCILQKQQDFIKDLVVNHSELLK
jgi:hypothetical protein